MSTSITTAPRETGVSHVVLEPRNMDEALRLAEFMARARTLPKHLQASPGDCLMVVEQAMRWGMSPFAVAQATSVISGKMMYEGKLVAAAVETSGAITGQLDYTFTGQGESRSIEVSATRRGETNPRTVTVTLREARTDNQMWKRQPDQQLVYHGARVWARRWTPAVILGVYSREEMGQIIEGEIVGEIEPIPAPKREPPKSRQTAAQWLDETARELADALDTEALNAIMSRPRYMQMRAWLTNGALDRLMFLESEAIERTTAPNDGVFADPADDPFLQPAREPA